MNKLSTKQPEKKRRAPETTARGTGVLRAQVEELRHSVEQLERLLDERAAELAGLQTRLAEITQSDGWQLLQVLYRIRYIVFPSGSGRERVARFCMGKLRRAGYHARQGPRAVVRAFGRMLARPFRRGERPAAPGAAPPRLSGNRRLPRVQPAIDPNVGVPGLVSVVLPVYNQADLLLGAIESVLSQTYPDVELIIVDDGSTDNVAAVLSRYVDHPKVRILTQRNQKLPKALSNGFEFAVGQFRSWTSADNLMEPTQLAREVDLLRRKPQRAMVYANYLAIDDRGEPLRDPSFRAHNRRAPDSSAIYLPHDPEPLNTVEDNYIGACFVYREWAGRLVGEYTPEMGLEDYDYWMRMNTFVKIAHLDSNECLYQYRVHDDTLSARAVELKICERVQRLMKRERERREACRQHWTILADEPTRRWLTQVDTAGDTILPVERLSSPEPASDKELVLIYADTLPQLAQWPRSAETCVAVWFGEEQAAAYRHRRELRDVADVCFVPGRELAGRMGLFNRAVFVAWSGQTLYDLAIAFGKSRGFYNATVSAEQRARELPVPFEVAGRRRRVLLQVDDFLQGGFEQVVLDLAATLMQEGMEASLLVLGERGRAVTRARQMGLRVLTLPDSARETQYRRLLRRQKIDLVNAHFSLFGAESACELQIPFVQTVHTSYVFLSPEELAAFRAADEFTTAYVCTSANTALYADLRLGLPVDKMAIIPNGLDLRRLELDDRAATRARVRRELGLGTDDFVFLNVGSIYRDKGQRMIVAALELVRREHPQAKLVLLGKLMEDAYLEEIRSIIEQGALADAVVFVDFREEVAAFYAMADAFVLPSFWEGWSLALAEALCMNLPIVATDVGSARDLLPPVGTHLVSPVFDTIADVDRGNIDRYVRREHPRLVADLAAAMKKVCADPLPPTLSAAARRAIDRRQAYRAYVRLFRWLLQGGAPSAARAWLHAAARTTPVTVCQFSANTDPMDER